MMKFSLWLLVPAAVVSYEDTCKPFKEIYTSGTELCEVMWDDSFKVVDDDVEPGYTMWFFDSNNNPNDEVTRAIFGESTTVDECHLRYFHKDEPGPEDDEMRECHPWKKNACCDSSTVASVDQINESYGPGYQWNRCGPMSQACERFFVMEACLYECEPSAGLFRKYTKDQVNEDDYNDWQIHQMPIQKSFCDAWYTACADDFFCGAGGGSFFGCAAYYEDSADKFEKRLANEEDKNKSLIMGLSATCVLAFIGFLFSFFLVHREKTGKPVFYDAPEGQQGVSS